MPHLSLKCFGPFKAALDSHELPGFRTNKVQALLIVLAVERQPHSRERLMELFWPGMPERSARHNLRQVLYYLRGMFPDLDTISSDQDKTAPLVVSNRQTIQLNPSADILVDINQFEELIEHTRHHDHLEIMGCHACGQILDSAVALYQGDFLADFYLDDSNAFEEWAQVRREGYRRKVLDALEVRTAMAIRKQDFSLAQDLAERQLEIDNLREGGCRQLMQALALSGRREEALAIYERCRRLLTEELGMEPARRTSEIYQQILAGDLTFDGSQLQGVRGYEIKEEIGAGAYGLIHRAIQPAVGREVAVKVIRRRYADNPEFIRRFEDEAHIIARLEHPYIVPLYDFWRDPEGAYLVMRYFKGGSLLDGLRNGPWEINRAVRMVDQIAAALAAAHHHGIVHRDIKPANILLDDTGNAYLSDFGIARGWEEHRGITAAGAVLGTPDYISPEQILNEGIGPKSDQYSLGAVIFETLTGEKPFGTAPVANLIYKHLHEPFPFIQEVRADMPSDIDDVIQKATAKRPTDRYPDILHLAEAFRQAVSGSPAEKGSTPSGLAGLPAQITNPYKGLQAFQEVDAPNFFGREALIDRLVDRLSPASDRNGRVAEHRFLALIGPSGSGKSSVVKAGLLPALREGALPGSEKWFVAHMVPGSFPLEELEMALWPIAVDPPPSLVEPMQRDTRGMLRTLRRILPDEPDACLFLVIDQFEELFTLVDDETRRDFFLDSLLAALTAPRSPLRVVITLRADYYDRPLQQPALGEILRRGTEIILPMNAEELAWAVKEPARRAGVALEDGLAEMIVADVVGQPGGLPLLQFALTELFELRQGTQMTRAAYHDIGGVRGALTRRAEMIYAEFGQDEQFATRQLFLRLVNLGKGSTDTRRRVLRSELETINILKLNAVIEIFVKARLLTLDRDLLSREPTVEVAHEALLREWDRLRGWLEEGRVDIRVQQQLARAAADWVAANEDPSYLLRGSRLDQFEAWAGRTDLEPTADERRYLEKSVASRADRHADEENRRLRELETAHQLAETEKARAAAEHRRAEEQAASATRLRRRAYTLAAVMLIAIGLAVTAFVFSRQAALNADLAGSRELAAAARLNLESDPELSLMLAVEALETAVTSEAEQSLHLALIELRLRQRLTGHQAAIQRAAYSPDGRFLALAAHGDELVTLWDAASGQKLHEFPINRCCWGLYFSENGHKLAFAGSEARFNLAVWDTNTAELLETYSLPVFASDIGFYALNSSWTRAGIYQRDGRVSLWNLKTAEKIGDLTGHIGSVELEFSLDGRSLVTYDNPNGVVIVWDSESGEQLNRFISRHFVNDHAVSPDGTRVALAVDAGAAGWQVDIWELGSRDGEEIPTLAVTLEGHPDTIRLIEFSRDGRLIASASKDGTSRVWNSRTGELLYQLQHGAHVRTVTFHPDGGFLLTGDIEGSARVWDISPEGLSEQQAFRANDGPTFGADLDPRGAILVTGGSGRMWEPGAGEVLGQLNGHTSLIMSVAFHPEGGRVATASLDGTARVWDPETGAEIHRLIGHGSGLISGGLQGVLDVAYNPGGDHLATAGADGTARIWDTESGEELLILPGHTSSLSTVAYSPDGRYLATGQASGNNLNVDTLPTLVKIWDAQSGQPLLTFDSAHGERVWGIAFSQNGRFLVTAGTDAVVRFWEIDFEKEAADLKAELTAHNNTVFEVVFSPDGQTLATATPDEVRLWDVSSFVEGGEENAIDELLVLPGGPALVFSPDGKKLITGGRDGLVRNYWLDPAELLAFAHTRLTRGWTENECRLYLHSERCPVGNGE